MNSLFSHCQIFFYKKKINSWYIMIVMCKWVFGQISFTWIPSIQVVVIAKYTFLISARDSGCLFVFVLFFFLIFKINTLLKFGCASIDKIFHFLFHVTFSICSVCDSSECLLIFKLWSLVRYCKNGKTNYPKSNFNK